MLLPSEIIETIKCIKQIKERHQSNKDAVALADHAVEILHEALSGHRKGLNVQLWSRYFGCCIGRLTIEGDTVEYFKNELELLEVVDKIKSLVVNAEPCNSEAGTECQQVVESVH